MIEPNFRMLDMTWAYRCRFCKVIYHSKHIYERHLHTCSMPEINDWKRRFGDDNDK